MQQWRRGSTAEGHLQWDRRAYAGVGTGQVGSSALSLDRNCQGQVTDGYGWFNVFKTLPVEHKPK